MMEKLERALHALMALAIALLLGNYVGRPIAEFISGSKPQTLKIRALEPEEARRLADPDGPCVLGPAQELPELPGYRMQKLGC